MSRRPWPAAVVVSAVVLSLGALGASPSRADPTPPLQWPGPAICASGTLVAGARTGTPARTRLIVDIEPCPGTEQAVVASARWGLADYYANGASMSVHSAYRFSSSGHLVATFD